MYPYPNYGVWNARDVEMRSSCEGKQSLMDNIVRIAYSRYAVIRTIGMRVVRTSDLVNRNNVKICPLMRRPLSMACDNMT